MNRKQKKNGSTTAGGHFRELDQILKKAGLRLKEQEAPRPDPAPVVAKSESEAELFERAMEDVRPVNWQHDRVSSSLPSLPAPRRPDLEDLRLMKAALEGIPAPSVLDHPEYIEGWIGVSGRLFIPHLRNGMYSIQGQIDLHGFSRTEAHQAVEEFIHQMARFRSCCVKIIHGRGINSRTDNAVLKENLQRWLTTKRMSRHVIAYASAPVKDGGVGAIYVLLRQRAGSK